MSVFGAGGEKDSRPRFDVGDRVVAARAVGGLLRPRVPAGSRGIVIGRGVDDRYTVAFGDRVEEVTGRRLVAT
jgi:hypothetical protein